MVTEIRCSRAISEKKIIILVDHRDRRVKLQLYSTFFQLFVKKRQQNKVDVKKKKSLSKQIM